MKQIINGLRYDTATATEVANYRYSNRTDFHGIEETLYRTEKGNFFLHGWGGAATSYARPTGNNGMTGGESITPKSDTEALAWLESKGKAEAIEQYFPEHIEDA